ncbi:MAG: sigma-70 family RNA polymerase sigma factor [Candidatus Acidiferrum sp.]
MTSTGAPQDNSQTILIERVRRGEHEAFYELVRPHERTIYAIAFSILTDQADAEEVAQEAILKAFKALGQFRHEAKFSTWIIQIVINEARTRLRKYRKHLYDSLHESAQGDDEGDYLPRDFADWREIPSEAFQTSELRQALSKALTSLPPKYRQVLILRDIQHLSTAESAQLLGITEDSVKTRLLRARLMMRDELAPDFDSSWNKGQPYPHVRPY